LSKKQKEDPQTQQTEINTNNINNQSTIPLSNSNEIELNSLSYNSFSLGRLDTDYISMSDLKQYIKYPMIYNEILRTISRQSYSSNGIYGQTIDRIIALPTLSYITTLRSKLPKMKEKKEQREQKTSSKTDKELYWVLGVMVAAIAVFLVGFTLLKESDSFNYNGLDFQKEMLGNIPLYKHTYLTERVTRTTGQVVRTGDASSVAILLRNDPRRLEDIPVEGKIEFLSVEQTIYISVNSAPELSCDYSPIAMHELSSFFTQNGFAAKAGISNETMAEENKIDYITCENRPDRMVISFASGDSPSIVRNGNCYILTVANCDILAPTEKFIIQSIIDAKEDISS